MFLRSLYWLLPLHFALTIPLALLLNLWIDEAYTLDTTQLQIWAAGQQAIQFENQPPLYFVLLSLWRKFNPSIEFARLFSVLCMALTVVLSAPLARRYCPTVKPVWVMVAIAFNPYCIWAATEIRTYGFAVLLSALLLLCFFEGYLSEPENPSTENPSTENPSTENPSNGLKWQVTHGAVSLAALYTNYFLGSLLIAQGLVLLALRRWRWLRTYCLYMVPVSLLFLPMLFVLAAHLASQGSGMDLQTDSTWEAVRSMVGRSLLYLWPSEFLPRGWQAGLRYGSLLGLGMLAIRDWRRWAESHVALAVMVAGCFGVLTVVLDQTDNASLAARYSYPLFVPLNLLLFSAIAGLRSRLRYQVLWVWGAIALFCYSGSLFQQYSTLAKDGDWQRVAAFIQSQEAVEQPVVVFSAEGILPLKYYYHGVNPLVSVPIQEEGGAYSLRRFVIGDETAIKQALGVRLPSETLPSELWLVQGPSYALEGTSGQACSIWGIDLNCDALQKFVREHYHVAQEQEFQGSVVQHLVRS